MKNNRLRLLFVARSFPPSENIASLRTKNIVKSLLKLNWCIKVVTIRQDLMRSPVRSDSTNQLLSSENLEIIGSDHHWRMLADGLLIQHPLVEKTGYGSLIRELTKIFEIDHGVGWIKPALQACENLKPGDVDVILTTAPPFSSFIIAEKLSDRLQCPFVIDYRDLWHKSIFRSRINRFFNRKTEKRLLSKASASSIVSPTLAKILRDDYGKAFDMHVITNGYDPSYLDAIEPAKFDHFAIIYAGSLHPYGQSLEVFLKGLKLFKKSGGEFASGAKFHYFGRHAGKVLREAKLNAMETDTIIHGHVPRDQVLAAIKGASAVVVVTAFSKKAPDFARGIITGKIYETLGLKTPIILLGETGSDAESILIATRSGCSFSNGEHQQLCAYLKEIEGGRLEKSYENHGQYTWDKISEKLNHLLRECVEKNHCQVAAGRRNGKVVLLTERIPPTFGGAGHRAYAYAKRLWKTGGLGGLISYAAFARTHEESTIQKTVVIKDPLDVEALFPVRLLIDLENNPFKQFMLTMINLFVTPISVFIKIQRLRREAKILHCFGIGLLTFWGVLVSKMFGLKTIVEVVLLGTDDPKTQSVGWFRLLKSFYRKAIFKLADRIVAISPALANSFYESGFHPSRIAIIGNPVDTDVFRPANPDERVQLKNKLHIPANANPVINFVGAITLRKGVDFLVEVFVALLHKRPDAILLLVGPSENIIEEKQLTRKLKAYAAQNGCENRLIFTGQVASVDAYLKISDLMIFPSRREGFGNAVIEAMATEVPVIALYLKDITDTIITNGHDGVYIETEDVDRFVEEACRLLDDREYYLKIAQNARRSVLEKFSIKRIDEQYQDLYRTVIKKV